jgi:small-conductance mechanosensitive channel
MPRSSLVPSYVAIHPMITSIGLIGVLLLLRWLLALLITAQKSRSPQWRRSWLVLTRNGLLATFVVGLFIIWRVEIQTFALSIVGIAVAMVIATKELILCISGTLMIRLNGAFSVGDRIEVAGYRGDVIDINLLATTIIETGPGQLTQQYTGRKVVVPNSLFVGNGFINETFTNEYVLHVFSVPVSINADWRALERCLLSAANESCAPYIEEARAHLDKLAHSEALNMPPVEVKVTLQIPTPEQINLIVRLPTPARTKGRIEQAILRKAMDCFPEWSPLNRPDL